MRAVYFASGMEGLPTSEVALRYTEINRLLRQSGLHLINPYEDEGSLISRETESDICKRTQEIVQRDLARLRRADILIVDLSIPGRSYVGCICEIVYAYQWQKPIVVYVGASDNGTRLWLRYHATHICTTREEAMRYISEMLPQN